jgi:hypothetical protein
MFRILSPILCVCMFASGCSQSSPRLNAPPQGPAEEVHDMQGPLVYMTDNALLADMSVSDGHFLPHRAMLSTTGEQRVHRLGQLMEAYGGTIRMNSNLEDETLLAQRTETVRTYLAGMGIDTGTEVVVNDMRGGAGMDAVEALLIKKNEGTYDPQKANTRSTTNVRSASGVGNP